MMVWSTRSGPLTAESAKDAEGLYHEDGKARRGTTDFADFHGFSQPGRHEGVNEIDY